MNSANQEDVNVSAMLSLLSSKKNHFFAQK